VGGGRRAETPIDGGGIPAREEGGTIPGGNGKFVAGGGIPGSIVGGISIPGKAVGGIGKPAGGMDIPLGGMGKPGGIPPIVIAW